ncbi:MAG: hypothetical protein ACFCBU_04115 [Cyanophyceae cyanobacterium]
MTGSFDCNVGVAIADKDFSPGTDRGRSRIQTIPSTRTLRFTYRQRTPSENAQHCHS